MRKPLAILLLCCATGTLIGCVAWLIHLQVEDPYHPADRLYYFKLFAGFFSFIGFLIGGFVAIAMSSKESRFFPGIVCVLVGALSGIPVSVAAFGEKPGSYLFVGIILGAAIGTLYYRRTIATCSRR